MAKRHGSMWVLVIVLLWQVVFPSFAQARSKKLVFGDAGWESNKFHNAVAGTVAKEVFGYDWEETPGSSAVVHEGLLMGEIDVQMEEWTDNLPKYQADLKAGKLQELDVNFDDNYQGIYVPRYVIEGDEERGIEPVAPDLRYVWDLKNYPEVFSDPETSGKGRVYGAITGWEVDKILQKKFDYYQMNDTMIYFSPGSETALQTVIIDAYDKGEPVAAYYWEPTALMGRYDMVLLEDEPYRDEEAFLAGETELPSMRVTVAVSNELYEIAENAELITFLSHYHTSSELTSKALAYMDETGASYQEAATWFLLEHKDLVEEWLKPDQAETLWAALSGKQAETRRSIYDFPVNLPVNFQSIDDSVRAFSVRHDHFFSGMTRGLTNFVNAIWNLLNFIPWFVLIGIVFVLTWRLFGKVGRALLYSILLFLIGAVGYWEMMNETLAVILASVLLSLVLGFPLGILISASDRADRMMRPILDTMQTMPVFVYLIPALLFFGLGKAPGVIATTIYAIVPMIRLTSLGIRGIDQEVVEASMAFGSTWIQALWKVKIPQAMPTIMTGINQTIMMAISMVVTTSMIGVRGLGMEVLDGVNKIEIGRGLISGLAIVILAVILDRITQGYLKRSEVKSRGQ